ncbi:MAG: two-component system response regulator [Chloroflexia bacterium]
MDTETNSKLIVIVEDHPETAALIAECVSEEPGYETVIAGDAGSGLEMIHARRPDLVLLDAWLPDVNGFQLYDTLHEESSTSDIPVIFITTSSAPAMAEHLEKRHIESFIAKPFELEYLLSRVREAVENPSGQ